jgi:hypothetical protein
VHTIWIHCPFKEGVRATMCESVGGGCQHFDIVFHIIIGTMHGIQQRRVTGRWDLRHEPGGMVVDVLIGPVFVSSACNDNLTR